MLTHLPTGFQIELFRYRPNDEHDVERFRRRRQIVFGELRRKVWIPAPEDVIIQKLRWQRRKDLDDIVGILAVSGAILDWRHLSDWTRRHGTDQLLEDLRRAVPPIDE